MKHQKKVLSLLVAGLILLSAGGAAAVLLSGNDSADEPTGKPRSRVPAGWTLCTNRTSGFSIAYPGGWDTAHLTAEQACNLFDADPITLDPNAGWPPVDMEVIPTGETVQRILRNKTDASTYRVIRREDVTVAGLKAVRLETVVIDDGFFAKGTKIYGYTIDRDGKAFVVETIAPPPTSDDRYAALRQTVDTAAESLRFDA